MIGDSNDEVMRITAKVDFTDLQALQEQLEELKREFEKLNKKTTAPSLRSKRDEIAKQIADTERLIQVTEKANATMAKATKTRDATIYPRNVATTLPTSRSGLDDPQKLMRGWKEHTTNVKNLRDEFEATKDSIEEVADANAALGDYLPTLTRKQRELAGVFKKELGDAAKELIKGAPGERPGQSEAALKARQSRIIDMRNVDPGRYVKGGQWVSSRMGMNEFSMQAGNKLDLILKAAITKGVAKVSATRRPVMTRYAPGEEDLGLPGYEQPENLYGREPGWKQKGLDEPINLKRGVESGVASSIPIGKAGNALADRMWLFVRDVRENFKEAAGVIQELYVTGDDETKKKLDAIAAEAYGTDVYDEAKEAFARLPQRKSKEGIPYKKEFGIKAHPMAALWSTKNLLGQLGAPDEALMPSGRLKAVRNALVGEGKYSDISKVPVPADVMAKREAPITGGKYGQIAGEVFDELENRILEFQNKMFKRQVIPGEMLKRVNPSTQLPEFYGQRVSFNKSRPGGDPSAMWAEFRELSRAVRDLRRTIGSDVNPLREILTGTARDMIGGMPKQKLGLGKYFDPLKLMDPSYMPGRSGWRGRLGTSSTAGNEAQLLEQGIGAQKIIDAGGIIGKLDVAGFNNITTKMGDVWAGPYNPIDGLVKSMAPVVDKMSNVSGIMQSAQVSNVVTQLTKQAEQINEAVQSNIEVPTTGGGVPPEMGVETPVQEMRSVGIEVVNVGDKIVQKFAGMNREIANLTTNYPGAKLGPLGPIQNVPRVTTTTEPVEVELEEPEPVGESVKIEKEQSYWKSKKGKNADNTSRWPSVSEIITKSGAMGMAEPGKEEEQQKKTQEWIKILAEKLPPTETLRNFVNRVYKEGEAAPDNTTVLAYANHLQELFQKNVMGKTPEIATGGGKGIPKIPGMDLPSGKPDFFQKMFGTDYKMKLSFTDFEEFQRAQEIMKQMPGFVQMTTKEYEKYGGAADDVLHTVEMTGKVKSEEDVQKVRYGAEYLGTGKSAVPEAASLQISQQRVNLSERLYRAGQSADKINWKLVRGQMALLGIAFSMQGAVRMVQSAWSLLGNQMSKLQTVFENIAMAMAFGPKSAQGFLKGMLGDSKNIVGAWKTYTGMMATINSMLAFMAYKIFSDKRIIDSIGRVVEKLVDKLSEPGFVDRIVNLIAMVIDNLPSILDGVLWLAELLLQIAATPGMGEVLKWMVLAGLAAQFLMTPLALLGGAFQLLSWILEGFGVVLSSVFKVGWITAALGKILAYFTGEFMVALTAGAATLALNIGIGFLVGLVAVRIMVEQGVTGWLASVGDMFRNAAPWLMDALSVFLWPLGMLGTLVLDIVTLQFASIPNDIAAVFLKAIIAASRIIGSIVAMIPIVGPDWAEAFTNSQGVMQAKVAELTAGGGATHRAKGGSVKSGQAYIVGEKGPEVFVPSGTGDIIPNHMTGYADGTVGTPFMGDPFETVPQTFAPITAKLEESATTYQGAVWTDVKVSETNQVTANKNKTATDILVGAVQKLVTSTRVSMSGSQWDKGTGTWQTPGMTKAYTEPNPPSTTAIPKTLYGSDLKEMYLRDLTQFQVTGKHTSWYNSLPAMLRDKLPSLSGGGYVRESGIAVVHKGETVVPETQSGNVNITNYVTATVNNKTDEKYLLDLMGKKYYGSY